MPVLLIPVFAFNSPALNLLRWREKVWGSRLEKAIVSYLRCTDDTDAHILFLIKFVLLNRWLHRQRPLVVAAHRPCKTILRAPYSSPRSMSPVEVKPHFAVNKWEVDERVYGKDILLEDRSSRVCMQTCVCPRRYAKTCYRA